MNPNDWKLFLPALASVALLALLATRRKANIFIAIGHGSLFRARLNDGGLWIVKDYYGPFLTVAMHAEQSPTQAPV